MKKHFLPRFVINQNILSHLMEIEKTRGFLLAAKLSNQWIKKMSRNALFIETHHTTHIEGTQLTFDQSKKILQGRQIIGANKGRYKRS